MSGFMRSGSTLLSSILSQNKNLLVTPHSNTSIMMESIIKNRYDSFDLMNDRSVDNVLNQFLPNFYHDKNVDYVLERSNSWSSPDSIDIIRKYIDEDFKMIFLKRDVLEILTSLCVLCDHYPGNEIDCQIRNPEESYLSLNDLRCDIFMQSHSNEFGIPYRNLHYIQNNFKDNILLIDYNDLVRKPEVEVSNIYDFLQIPRFNHRFVDIDNYSYENKSIQWDLYKNRRNIKKKSKKPSEVLSSLTIEKYKNLL